MQFTTKIPIEKFQNPITYESKILSMGSCFAENMSAKFEYFKFQNITNPFGIIFNPVSIEKLVNRIINKIEFTEVDIFFHNELWHCYEVHSELSNPNKVAFLKRLNQIIEQSNNQMINCSHIILTLGTSWVYRNSESSEIVANCHKIPQKQFTKELLSVEVIEKSIANIVTLVHHINKNVKFIFTISPVRHIKDGFIENTISKAHLSTALHNFLNRIRFSTSLELTTDNLLNTEHYKLNTEYFPSYEILLDELRDYRFYVEDMLHPSQLAIDYIWQRFKETVISENSYTVMEEVGMIQKALAHRPFNEESESHLKFIQSTQEKISNLHTRFSFIKF